MELTAYVGQMMKEIVLT